MKNSKKLLSLLLAGTMMIGLLAGCGPKEPAVDPSAPVTDKPAEGYVLNLCIASEPQTIDPALNSSVDGAIMTQHMFEGLMKWVDSGKAVEGATINSAVLEKGQAKDYTKTTNDDGTVTYVFTLRDDIKWSDGKPVTAGDFVYSWQRLVAIKTAADYRNMLNMVTGYNEITGSPALDANGNQMYVTYDKAGVATDVEGVEYDANHEVTSELPEGAVAKVNGADPSTLGVKAVDDKTLEVTLINDCPYFLEVCAFPALLPVRQDVIEAKGDEWTFDTASYIGNGAYKMSEWVHNASISMVKNDQYYDYANLGPDTINFVLSDDQNAMLAGYRSDELDFIEDMPVAEVANLLATDELKIVPYLGTYYVCYQTQKAPFDDPRVRQAFTLAINSRFIVEKVTQTGQIPATGFVAPGVADAEVGSDFRATGGDYWDAPLDDATYKANVEKANKLLDEAGYTDRSKFPPVEYLYNTSENHKAIGEALQSQWQEGLGVQVTLKNQDWAVFLQTRKDGDYQIARNGWISDYNDPMAYLDMWLTGGGNNDAQYASADYDAAINEALTSSDPEVRMKAMHKAEDIIIGQDWALGPIYFYTQKYMLKDSISNVSYTPLGYFFFQYATKA
ncbi:MAG: peptide ABC transporter substrate-binding protein [Oscillospiraceae bacterium]